MGKKFASYGACLVAAIYPFAWINAFSQLDSQHPLDSIARNQALISFNRGIEYRIDFLCQMLRDFSVDGMVMQISRTCRPYVTEQIAITKEAEKRTGIPAVFIEGDMVDSRLFSQEEADSRIESFMEILAKKKG